MKRIILVLVLLNASNLFSQSLSVFDIDTSSFPVMKAKFYALDGAGKQILNLSSGDFAITENGMPRTVLSVSCPAPKPEMAISLAMSLDISGSMGYTTSVDLPVDLGKTTALQIADIIPMPPNEMAMQSCHATAFLNQDFTKNKNRLLSAINSLQAGGDNDFVEHLLNPLTGILNIAKTGKNKRVAVIYTDAWWYAMTDSELQRCKDTCIKYGITFFAIIYTRPEAEPNGIKQSLKELCESTGGFFYDGITTQEAAKDIAYRLKIQAQNTVPCNIEWQSDVNCFFGNTNVEISLNTNKTFLSYFPPANSYANLEFSPSGISFKNKSIGIKADTTITATAKNSDFNVTDIKSSSPNFDINPKSFLLKKGESKSLTVSFTPLDSNRYYTNFEIVNDKCRAKIFASAYYFYKKSANQTLKLTHPNGGEQFLAGTDTIITWEGILPNDTVKLEYSIDNGNTWKKISDSATGLKYYLKDIPKPASDKCLARVSIINSGDSIPQIEWQKSLGGLWDDEAYSLEQTSDGGYIVAGCSESNEKDVTGNHGGNDYWIVKLTQTGGIEWQKSLGGTSSDNANSIHQTIDGGYIVAGYSCSKDGDVTGNHGGNDYWIVKLNNTGGIEWQKSLGGTSTDIANSIQQTIDGGYIVGGYSCSKDGDVTGNHGGYDYWIVKLNSRGDIEWQKSMGGAIDDQANSIQQTFDGGYIVAGYSCSEDGDVTGNHGGYDYWIVKLNSRGDIEWQKSLGSSNYDEANSIQQTIDGGYIVAGYSSSKDGDVTGNHGGNDYWIVKLNSTGGIEWQKSLGGSNYDEANSIHQTIDGGYIVAGICNSIDGDVTDNHGGSASWIVKLNSIGYIEWQDDIGSLSLEIVNSIQQTKDGGYIVVGSKYTNDGDVTGIRDAFDYWIVKLSPERVDSQTDVSDSLWAIVVPEAASADIDMGKTFVNIEKDSIIQGFVKNVGSYPIHVNRMNFSGVDASMFAVGAGKPPFDIPVGASVPVEFCFKPSSAGIKKAQILIETLDTTLVQNIRGEGIIHSLAVNTKLVDFGVIELGKQKDTTIILLKNTGSSDISINNTQLLGPDKTQFEIISGGGAFTLQPNDTRELKLTFKPQFIGRTTGEIGFDFSGTGSPAKALLYGEGVVPPQISLVSVDSVHLICESDTIINVKITNLGSQDLTINSISINGADSKDFNTKTILPIKTYGEDTSNIFISFSPKSLGTKNIELKINSNSKNNSILKLNLNGVKDSANISLYDYLIDFGQIPMSFPSIKTISLKNYGSTFNKALISVPPPFTLNYNYKYLKADGNADVTVEFPGTASVGTIEDYISIIDTICNYEQKVRITVKVISMDEAVIELGSAEGKPGDIVEIPVSLTKNQGFQLAGVQGLNLDIGFNNTLLAPLNYSVIQVHNDTSFIKLNNLSTDSTIIAKIKFIAGLGNAESSLLSIKNVSLIGGTAPYYTVPGIFKLLGICEEGGKRLINPDSKNLLMMVRPNPAGEEAEIEYQLAEKENSKIYITSLLGENIKTVFEGNNSHYELQRTKIDLSQIPAGTYFLILQTPTERKSVRFVVNR